MTREPKLKPCRCGRPAEVKYICGLGRGVIEYSTNPFRSSWPTLYISCPVCRRNLCIRITKGSSIDHRDRAKRKLIKRWNDAMDADSIPTNTRSVYEVKK